MINKKPSTLERYDGIYRNYVENSPVYDLKLKDLSVADIQKFYNGLVK